MSYTMTAPAGAPGQPQSASANNYTTTTPTGTPTTAQFHNLSNSGGKSLPRPPRKSNLYGLATASSPNLSTSYSRLAAPQHGLSRKASQQALTPNSLAAIPDDSESYAIGTVLNDSEAMLPPPPPLTPGRPSGDGHIAIGDIVDVPGNMHGTVRFVGNVDGRKGIFAGVELHPEFAARGKNNGDVDGISYFTTTKPGAGIFLPLTKAVKRDLAPSSTGSYPITPMNPPSGLKVGNQNSTNYTPPTPSIPKFNQSTGPGRAPSPLGKKSSRPSLARPESPIRRLQMTPNPRPAIATPGSKVPSRYGSPTSKFSQSVRGTAPDPAKRALKSVGPRSASALGNRAPSAAGFTDDEAAPIGLNRSGTNGSVGSVTSFQAKLQRPASRANGRASPHRRNGSDELERLRLELADRDRQLKEQVQLVVEMETSLTELQTFISKQGSQQQPPTRRGSTDDDKDVTQLRALLREKNEKIAMLTAEFDAHRADFRSTIDTLEMASTETERVYEKKLEEVMQELQDYQERTTDVNAVARQLKQLEELVQELEEGLEDARRGEAEARGEVEFLRGEVERTRSELRREREKAAAGSNGAGAGNGNATSVSKELEQKEDEIRGLKAIIHSLSRDSIPGMPGDDTSKTPTSAHSGARGHLSDDSAGDRLARERLEREVAELRALLDSKNSREEEIMRELDTLRKAGGAGSPVLSKNRVSVATIVPTGQGNDRSSVRDSRDTVILAGDDQKQQDGHQTKANEPRSSPRVKTHVRVATLDTMPESDAYSTATDTSTLYCELCETAGHGILNCTNMFGGNGATAGGNDSVKTPSPTLTKNGGLSLTVPHDSVDAPAPLSPIKTKTPTPPSVPAMDAAQAHPSLMESGPVAGKESGVIDAEKWCALCERDGHDSVDCPFEDVAF
ncbi:hypothetical protein M0657_002623 [Pyricularia oryzae]|nr:hypothetical protein M0657_002623 [Pyricularia oryzae]